jgi:hypothetical protein
LHDPNLDAFFWELQRNDEFPDWLIASMYSLFRSGNTHVMRLVAGDVSTTIPQGIGVRT